MTWVIIFKLRSTSLAISHPCFFQNSNMMQEADDESSAGYGRQDETSRQRRQTPSALDNCWQHAGLCCFKTKHRTHISALEYKLKKRQKQFGIDYLNLVERKAGEVELKRCLRNAMDEIEQLQEEIDMHLAEIEGRENQMLEATAASKQKDDSDNYDPEPNTNTQSAAKKKKKKAKTKTKEEEEPDQAMFTIDSDDEEEPPEQSPKKKKKNKKKKKGQAQ